MIVCQECGFKNEPGTDLCEVCGQPLAVAPVITEEPPVVPEPVEPPIAIKPEPKGYAPPTDEDHEPEPPGPPAPVDLGGPTCRACGTRNYPDLYFCAACG